MCRHSYLLCVAPAFAVAVAAVAFALFLPEYNYVTLEPVNLKAGAFWFGDDALRAEQQRDEVRVRARPMHAADGMSAGGPAILDQCQRRRAG